MAVVCSKATGNFTTAGTWFAVETATSYLNSETGSTTVPTAAGAGSRSSSFTPGAITIDAIGVKLANRTGTTGTIRVLLRNITGAADVAGTTVTLNMTDLPAATTALADGGWIVFKMSAPVTLAGATAYAVDVITSSATQAVLFTDVTANNWSRILRTNTTGAPTTGDDIIIAGEHTGAGTGNSFTVTMDSTAATDYGSNTTTAVTPALAICKRGTLSNGIAAATDYILRLSGHAIVYSAGTFNIGSTAAEVPRGSTAVLEFDCAADGDFGLIARNGSTLSMQGLSRTIAKDVAWCRLNTDEAIASTSLGVDTDTGWLDNDVIVVASTIKPGAAQTEAGAMNGNAAASTLTVDGFGGAGGGLAFAHLGGNSVSSAQTVTLPDGTTTVNCVMAAEIINLTRSVKVRSVTSTNMTFVASQPTASVTLKWTEFRYLGTNTTGKRGVELDTSSAGVCTVTFCSFRDNEFGGLWMAPATTDFTGTATDNVFYNIGAASTTSRTITIDTVRTGGGAYTISRNCILGGGGNGIFLDDISGIVKDNAIAGLATMTGCINLVHNNGVMVAANWTGNVIHSNGNSGSYGFQCAAQWASIYFKDLAIWRNNLGSAEFYSQLDASVMDLENVRSWGNGFNIVSTGCLPLKMRNCVFASDSSTTTNNTFFLDGGLQNMLADNSLLTVPASSGFLTDVNAILVTSTGSTTANVVKFVGRNVSAAAATIVGTPSVMTSDSFVSFERYGGVAASHRTYLTAGLLTIDSAIFHTAAPSMRMTPSSASVKCPSAPDAPGKGILVPMTSAAARTVSVWVRKSVVGDGTAYNGNQPRLIQRANPALGQYTDTVLATAAAAAGSWEQLSASTSTPNDNGAFEFVVDCDGTTGWVNVDDWGAT